MGLEANAQFQCLPVSIPVKKIRICHKGINCPAVSRRHRPTEHPAVVRSKPFIPDDALRDLFPNRAETYLHGNSLVNTLVLVSSLFLAILCTPAAIARRSPALQQVPPQPDANQGWQAPSPPRPPRSRVSPLALGSGDRGNLGRSHPTSSAAADISQGRRQPKKPTHQRQTPAIFWRPFGQVAKRKSRI